MTVPSGHGRGFLQFMTIEFSQSVNSIVVAAEAET